MGHWMRLTPVLLSTARDLGIPCRKITNRRWMMRKEIPQVAGIYHQPTFDPFFQSQVQLLLLNDNQWRKEEREGTRELLGSYQNR
jgi:hypothetical protein